MRVLSTIRFYYPPRSHSKYVPIPLRRTAVRPDLGLPAPLLELLDQPRILKHPSAIQAEAIPTTVAGDDLLRLAQTGTGKTAGICSACWLSWH